jgi:acetyl-CoA acyltransferase
MGSAVIVDAVRTAAGRGKMGGALSSVHPVDLLATVLQELVSRTGIDPAQIDDVIGGCVTQAGQQAANITRNAVFAAGFPESVPATTVDRQCGSSQQAAAFAAQGVISGFYDIVIAAGVESMSRAPMFSAMQGQDVFGAKLAARYPEGLVTQGISAEIIASRWKLDRTALDEFAARSHRLAAHAAASGAFAGEIVGVETTAPDGSSLVHSADETIRPATTVESLAGLRPAFQGDPVGDRFPEINWSITAGNSSPLTDGASAVLIMSEQAAERLGLRPRARFHSFSVIGDDPVLMLTGIIPATRKVLARTGLGIEDIDAYEVNEAFASVPLAWLNDLAADPERLNQRGGAIALGHALGASGARLLTTLLSTLESTGGRYGLQTMCEGGGMANATIIERL